MEFHEDNRGQTIQIGAIFLFATLIISMSIFQAHAVPQHNAEIEFKGYQEATADMAKIQNTMFTSATQGVTTGTTVKTGVEYPARMFFVNPPPATGSIYTADPEQISITNATALGPDEADYWNGSTKTFTTRNIRFEPRYHQIDVRPLVLGTGVAYKEVSDTTLLISDSTLMNGNRISLLTVEGDMDASGKTTDVMFEPVSAATRTTSITGTESSDIHLTVPSTIPASTWETEILAGEPNVVGVNQQSGAVEIVLDGSETYTLRLGRVEVREKSAASTASTDAHYLVGVGQANRTVASNQNATLTVEVRDQYNNPKVGETVTFHSSDGTFSNGAGSINVTTNEAGRASASFDSSAATATVTAEADFDGSGTLTDLERTIFTAHMQQSQSVAYSLNPSGKNKVILNDTEGNSDNVTAWFNNTDTVDRKIVGMRFNFWAPGSDAKVPDTGTILDTPEDGIVTPSIPDKQIPVGLPGSWVSFNSEEADKLTLGANSTTAISWHFETGKKTELGNGDYFILSVEWANGSTSTYFVGVTQ